MCATEVTKLYSSQVLEDVEQAEGHLCGALDVEAFSEETFWCDAAHSQRCHWLYSQQFIGARVT